MRWREQNTMAESTQVRALVTEALKQGAGSVEEVHRKIAAMPVDALRRFGFGGAADTADKATDTVYDTVRQVNDQVSRVARDFLSQTPGTEGDRSAG
jgi:hypothetical protein